MKEVILQLCGRTLGTTTDLERFGTCDRELNHGTTRGGWRGCSSKALRAYQREATEASRERKKKAEAKEKAKEAAIAAGEIDDSILDEHEQDDNLCRCGHSYGVTGKPDTCPSPQTCGLSKAQIEERAKREAEETARKARVEAALIKQAEERRFLTQVLDRNDAGGDIDHETQKRFLETVVSYLGVDAKLFRLDRETRINKGFNEDGINERRLSNVLYGPEYIEGFHAPPELDEHSFSVRLGRFLGVLDMRGSMTYVCTTTPPTVPIIPAVRQDLP